MEDTQKFKCLVLYTAQTGIAKQKVEQDHLFRLLQTHRIGYDVVDGATASNKELRTKLFDLAGKGVLYPLVFFRSSSDPGEFTFVGDFASIYKWNEQEEATGVFTAHFKSVFGTAVGAPVAPPDDSEWITALTDTGEKYWYHRETGETSWTPPMKPGEYPWVPLQDDEGDTYYFNRETQETSWEEPPGWAEAQANAKAGASGLAAALPAAGGGGGGGEAAAEEEEAFTGDVGNLSDWEQFSDDEGDPYWHNATLDASSWFPPPGWEAHLASRAARA
ncbi:unnamed protein product [Symbiodinium sp. KB8]|nr:unnamed protein product [Symbiodinium sp. KB8]